MTRTWQDDEGHVWFGCSLIPDEKTKDCVKEPSAMSELGGLIDEDRDWKSIAIEKARELALMTKVADLWQRRLIKANKRIAELENDRTSASD
jgi:hypothetical protein